MKLTLIGLDVTHGCVAITNNFACGSVATNNYSGAEDQRDFSGGSG